MWVLFDSFDPWFRIAFFIDWFWSGLAMSGLDSLLTLSHCFCSGDASRRFLLILLLLCGLISWPAGLESCVLLFDILGRGTT